MDQRYPVVQIGVSLCYCYGEVSHTDRGLRHDGYYKLGFQMSL